MSNYKVEVTDPISIHLQNIVDKFQEYQEVAQELRELIAKTFEFDNIEVKIKTPDTE